MSERPIGKVYLVGAGPGDPRLITVGGADALRKANVVVYDRLAHPSLLNYVPEAAERVYVGKKADHHAMVQDDINQLLADRALAGKTVVRLKGGDPFVFGRGGEEAEFLRERGVTFIVIPGVTSSIAGPAYAGIPVTHRDAASSFAVITGHERDSFPEGVMESSLVPRQDSGSSTAAGHLASGFIPEDSGESGTREAGAAEGRRRWENIAHAADTLVFLMGVENLEEIASRLTANGRSPETPVSLTRWATWAGRQQTLTGTLSNIVELVREAGFKAPAVTVVGDVVGLRDKLRWFDTGPLAGKRVLVTRAREQASDLVTLLREANAEPIEFPLIKSIPPADGYETLDAAIDLLPGDDLDDPHKSPAFQWILFASATAAEAFFARLIAGARDTRALAGIQIGAVGAATALALRNHGIVADFVPEEATGMALATDLPGTVREASSFIDPVAMELDDTDGIYGLPGSDACDLSGQAILIPRATSGDDALPRILTERGANVTLAPAYETVIDAAGADVIRERLAEGSIDVVTFTSSSTVKNFVEAIGVAPESVTLACIGPSTAKTAVDLFGRQPDIVADIHTISGLLSALEWFYMAAG